jgi:hypothetical protein
MTEEPTFEARLEDMFRLERTTVVSCMGATVVLAAGIWKPKLMNCGGKDSIVFWRYTLGYAESVRVELKAGLVNE